MIKGKIMSKKEFEVEQSEGMEFHSPRFTEAKEEPLSDCCHAPIRTDYCDFCTKCLKSCSIIANAEII